MFPGLGVDTLRCSRNKCALAPQWQVVWRNPKIHSEDRRKIWLSCEEHRSYFEGYLSQRGFPVHSEALEGSSS